MKALMTGAGVAMAIVLASCGNGQENTRGAGVSVPVTDEESARRAFAELLEKHPAGYSRQRWIASDFHINCEQLDPDTWIVRTRLMKGSLALTWVYIGDEKGLRRATIENISDALHDYHAANPEVPAEEVIGKLVELLDPYWQLFGAGVGPSTLVLRRAGDIPGYTDKPLPADVEGEVSPPRQIAEPETGSTVYVIYAYQRMGGVVWRYRIRFKSDPSAEEGTIFESAEATKLARDIGQAWSLI